MAKKNETNTEKLTNLRNMVKPEVPVTTTETPDPDMDAVNAAVAKALSDPALIKAAYEKLHPPGNRTRTVSREGDPNATFEVKPSSQGKEGFVEIFFSGKPDSKTRTILKDSGFRWSAFSHCWYGPAKLLANDTKFGTHVKQYVQVG